MYIPHNTIPDDFMSSNHKTLSYYTPLKLTRCACIVKTTEFMIMVCEILPQMYKYFYPRLLCPCTPPYISTEHSLPIKRSCSRIFCYPTIWGVAIDPGTVLVVIEHWPQIFHLFPLSFPNSIYFHSNISELWFVILISTLCPFLL